MKTHPRASIISLSLCLAAFTAACGNPSNDGSTSSNSSAAATTGQGGNAVTTSAVTSGSTSTSTSTSTSSSAAGGGGPTVEEVVAYDPASFELPEGLAISGTNALVGLSFSGEIDAVPIAGGAKSPYASLPTPPPNTSFMTGVGVDGAGAIYGALVSFTSAAQPGIYKSPQAGGAATLFASDPAMVFPNGLAWSDTGVLYVADSSYGGVFRVAVDGTTTPWFQDAMLGGEPTACGGAATDLSIGANGIAFSGGALYVASSNKGVLARVPIGADGKPGTLSIVAGPDCALAGIDGITFDADGTIIAALNKQNKLVRIDAAGSVTTLVSGGLLDFPASLAFAGQGNERALYVTSFAYLSATTGMPAHPALLRVHLGG